LAGSLASANRRGSIADAAMSRVENTTTLPSRMVSAVARAASSTERSSRFVDNPAQGDRILSSSSTFEHTAGPCTRRRFSPTQVTRSLMSIASEGSSYCGQSGRVCRVFWRPEPWVLVRLRSGVLQALPWSWTNLRISDRRLGAIGIDINLGATGAGRTFTELDRFGNFLGGESMGCVTYGKRRGQAKALLGDAVKQAMSAAIRTRKPIVVERLEFAQKKSTLENEGSGRARRLSSFAYQQTLQHLQAAAFRAGLEVIAVHPAYTSTIGAVNYAARFGISIHQGAAIAIARRSLGLSERPAMRVAQVPTRRDGHGTLLVPARNRSRHVWSLCSEVSRRIRAALRAPVQLLPATGGSTSVSRCLQTPCAT
jgi:IS605 OrfB family transposase